MRIRHAQRRKTYFRILGLKGLWFHWRELLGDRRTVRFFPPGVQTPISIRLNSTDLYVFNTALIKKDYSFQIKRKPKVILDAGANIGLTTLYFAQKYPESLIYAIEPESENYALLKKNTSFYPNVICIQAALWKTNEPVRLYDRNTGQWGFSVFDEKKRSGSYISEVPGITIPSLMERYKIESIDILKMDIEGSEKEVFENSSGWIHKVGVIAVELHERIKAGCRRSFYKATNRFEHEFIRGEKLVFVMRDGYFCEQEENEEV
jgi:FkbM family methyltransferase